MAETNTTASAADLMQQLKAMADGKGTILCMQEGQPVMLPVASLLAQMQQAGGLSPTTLAAPDSLNLLGQVQSFDELRKLKPSANGVRVSLRGWNSGTRYGGGEFVATVGSKAADDGGVVASSGQNWYWSRVCEDLNKLDVTHFGALPDGKTDTLTAFTAMYNWTQKNLPELGVQYPAGRFYLSRFSRPTSVNLFRVSGAQVNFGYFPATTLLSDDKDEFLLDVKARKTEISNIIFNGRGDTLLVDDGKGGKIPNKKGFYRNVEIQGQFVRVNCVKWERVGGTCMAMVDTLDTKISQWYASKCTGDILKATWSDSDKGGWNHSTAIELTNFNVQYCTGGKVLNLPRATQSLISNGWIEHCDNPGDISNGQWVISALSIEDCKGSKLNAAYSRLIEMQRNLQSGSGINYDDDPAITRWLNIWEAGRIDIQNHGVFVGGSLDAMAYASRNKLNNNSADSQWFCLGKFFSPETGDSIDINMVGCGNNLTVGDKLDKLDDVRQGGGNTLIRAHLTKAGVQCSHQPCGSSPLLDVVYVPDGNNIVTIYVQLKPYTYNVIPMVTFTGKTHFEAGISLYWLPDLSTKTQKDIDGLEKSAHSKENWSMGQKAGVGGSDEGYLLLKSKTTEKNKDLIVKIEGKLYTLALTEYKEPAPK